MAQHDYVLSNAAGASFRADLNNALAAIVSQNSGANAPSTTYAYQWWADTTAGVLKLRNAANNAWITILQLDGEWSTIALENGTAAAPSLYFKDSGTDTGLFSPGADLVAIATGGVERVRFTSAGAVFSTNVQVPSINGGPLAGFRNAIINGNFDIWQRGTSFTGSEYGADRWINARVGTTHTATRQAFTLGQSAVPGEPQFFCRTAVSSVAGANNYAVLIQRIEDVRTFAGQQVTASFWAKADATKGIALEIFQNFGTGGSPSAEVNSIGTTKVSIGTSWQKVTVTATVPSISGKTLGTDNNHFLALQIWFDAGSTYNSRTDSLGQQSGTFDIAQVQIEPGPVASPFERRPVGVELSLCQRYYQELTRVGWRGDATTGQIYAAWYNYSTMRTMPSVVIADVSLSGFAAGVAVVANGASYLQAEATCNSTGANRFWLAIVKLDAEL
jgi:hypothetical protein